MKIRSPKRIDRVSTVTYSTRFTLTECSELASAARRIGWTRTMLMRQAALTIAREINAIPVADNPFASLIARLTGDK